MRSDRRKFLRVAGASAVGFGVSALLPRAFAQNALSLKGMKMIIRIDDVGYTDVCNEGAFLTIDKGVATAADVMLDTPGTIDALERLKKTPWISVGWHAHFWGSPLLDPKEVPSMLIKDGDRIRFRKDLRTAADVSYDEALKECRAQMERAVKILGKALDTGPGEGNLDKPLGKAMVKVCEEYGVAYNFASRQSVEKDGTLKYSDPDSKWASKKIITLAAGPAYKDLFTDSIKQIKGYDPFKYYSEDRARLKDAPAAAVVEQSWHPGWVDYYVYMQGDYGPAAQNFIASRTQDVEFLCSDRMKKWLKDSGIELVNYRDALYGTRDYQNHLRQAGSELYVGA